MRNLLNYGKNEQSRKAKLISTSFRNMAFTLAEVLITLGIIGVVAAMTMPTLVQKYQEKVTVTRLKKAYSMMNNAYLLARIDNGEFGTWFEKSSGDYDPSESQDSEGNSIFPEINKQNADRLWDKFEPYLKVISRCKTSDSTCQKYDAIYSLDGTKRPDGYTKDTTILNLADGITLLGGYVNFVGDSCNNEKACGEFSVDVNGYKGPNTFGKDIFHLWFLHNRIVPNGDPFIKSSLSNKDTCNPSVKGIRSGMACAAWVIYNENMDYLRCADELSWNGKTKCK